MQPQQILSSQQITLKRGRTNGLGFEPAFNSFFDYYLDTRYFKPALLQLEDVTFFLYLRKNLNDADPERSMPSRRQIFQKFGIGHARYDAIMTRLRRARLVVKASGVRTGIANTTNEYILSDPLPHLEQFLVIKEMGLFDVPEMGTYQNGGDGAEMASGGGAEIAPYDGAEMAPGGGAEIALLEQTSINREIWTNILSILKQHLGRDQATFFDGSQLESLAGGTATIVTNKAHAVDWLNRQMGPQLRRMLTVETGSKISAVVVHLGAE